MTEQDYIDSIKKSTSINNLEVILENAKINFNSWPKIMGRIIDCKLSRELDLVFKTDIYMTAYEKRQDKTEI